MERKKDKKINSISGIEVRRRKMAKTTFGDIFRDLIWVLLGDSPKIGINGLDWINGEVKTEISKSSIRYKNFKVYFFKE